MLRPRELIVTVAVAAMEAMALLPIMVGIGFVATEDSVFQPAALFLLAAAAGVAASLGGRLYGRIRWLGRLLLVLGALLAVLLPAWLTTDTTGGTISLVLALGVVYWRGVAAVLAEPEAEDVVYRFTTGLGAFVAGCVVATARGMMFEPRTASVLTLAGVAFVLAALIGLAASSLRRSLGGGGVETSIAALTLFFGAVAAMAAGGYLLVTSHIGGAIATALSPVWDAVVYGIAATLTFILSPLFALIQRTHFRLPRMPVMKTPNTLGHRIPTPQPRPGHHVFISHSTDAILAAIVIGVAVLLLGFIIWRTASALGTRRAPEKEREDETVEWSLGAIWHGILGWIQGLFRGTARATVATVQRVRQRIGGPSYPSDPVRRVYAQVLYRAAVNGLARPAATTPLEFERELTYRWPDGAPDFAAVTEAYIRRRYGEVAPEGDEIASLKERWQRLRTIMRRPKPST